MQTYLHQFYRNFPNVKTVYIRYEESQHQDALFDGSHLTFLGTETYIPGILRKTYKSFEYFSDEIDRYDFIIRSNISSIVDFQILQKLLGPEFHKIDYFGGIVSTLRWLDPKGGIHDTKHFGQRFASGTLIGLAVRTVRGLLSTYDQLDENIIDDVAISLHVKAMSPETVVYSAPTQLIAVNQQALTREERKNRVAKALDRERPLLWRVKTTSRDDDAYEISIIVKSLLRLMHSDNRT